jgi:hypothetical protein
MTVYLVRRKIVTVSPLVGKTDDTLSYNSLVSDRKTYGQKKMTKLFILKCLDVHKGYMKPSEYSQYTVNSFN